MFDVKRGTLRGLSACLHVIVCEVKECHLMILPEVIIVAVSVFNRVSACKQFFFYLLFPLSILCDILICALNFAGRMQADHGTAKIQ